jgi:hypothetical protein
MAEITLWVNSKRDIACKVLSTVSEAQKMLSECLSSLSRLTMEHAVQRCPYARQGDYESVSV